MKLWICNRAIALCLCATALVAGPMHTNQAWAQKPKPDAAKTKGEKNSKVDPTQPAASMEIAKVEGKWDAFSQGIIKILNAENQELFLQSESDTVINYMAEAEPAWLMPGYMVRFSAALDQNGKPTAPVKAIEVFTPSTRRRMSPEEMREQTPGIHREDKSQPQGANGLFAEKEKKPQPKAKPSSKKDLASAPGQSYRIVGQIGGIQNNVVTVMASTPIQIEIDPTAAVTVKTGDISSALALIAKGDSVSVSGLRNPAQPAQIYCEQITIKAAKKLTQAMPPTKRGKGSTRDKDADTKNSNAKDKDAKDKADGKKTTPSDKKPQ